MWVIFDFNALWGILILVFLIYFDELELEILTGCALICLEFLIFVHITAMNLVLIHLPTNFGNKLELGFCFRFSLLVINYNIGS